MIPQSAHRNHDWDTEARAGARQRVSGAQCAGCDAGAGACAGDPTSRGLPPLCASALHVRVSRGGGGACGRPLASIALARALVVGGRRMWWPMHDNCSTSALGIIFRVLVQCMFGASVQGPVRPRVSVGVFVEYCAAASAAPLEQSSTIFWSKEAPPCVSS